MKKLNALLLCGGMALFAVGCGDAPKPTKPPTPVVTPEEKKDDAKPADGEMKDEAPKTEEKKDDAPKTEEKKDEPK